MGYLKRLADKKWRIRYDVSSRNDGRRKQKAETLVNVTKPQAEAILADRKRGIVAGEYILEDLTVTELFCAIRAVQITTCANHCAAVSWALPDLLESEVREKRVLNR